MPLKVIRACEWLNQTGEFATKEAPPKDLEKAVSNGKVISNVNANGVVVVEQPLGRANGGRNESEA